MLFVFDGQEAMPENTPGRPLASRSCADWGKYHHTPSQERSSGESPRNSKPPTLKTAEKTGIRGTLYFSWEAAGAPCLYDLIPIPCSTPTLLISLRIPWVLEGWPQSPPPGAAAQVAGLVQVADRGVAGSVRQAARRGRQGGRRGPHTRCRAACCFASPSKILRALYVPHLLMASMTDP